MKTTFTVNVDLDHEAIELEAKRRGFTLSQALEAVVSDAENRIVAALQFRDCLARVGVERAK